MRLSQSKKSLPHNLKQKNVDPLEIEPLPDHPPSPHKILLNTPQLECNKVLKVKGLGNVMS